MAEPVSKAISWQLLSVTWAWTAWEERHACGGREPRCHFPTALAAMQTHAGQLVSNMHAQAPHGCRLGPTGAPCRASVCAAQQRSPRTLTKTLRGRLTLCAGLPERAAGQHAHVHTLFGPGRAQRRQRAAHWHTQQHACAVPGRACQLHAGRRVCSDIGARGRRSRHVHWPPRWPLHLAHGARRRPAGVDDLAAAGGAGGPVAHPTDRGQHGDGRPAGRAAVRAGAAAGRRRRGISHAHARWATGARAHRGAAAGVGRHAHVCAVAAPAAPA
eukprot:360672-Chlamydomonas_euryale.AAC.8